MSSPSRRTQAFLLTLHDPHGGFPHLLPASVYLWGYLRQRSQTKPDMPLWFGSLTHLAMMSNLPYDRCETALAELIACGLVVRSDEGGGA